MVVLEQRPGFPASASSQPPEYQAQEMRFSVSRSPMLGYFVSSISGMNGAAELYGRLEG